MGGRGRGYSRAAWLRPPSPIGWGREGGRKGRACGGCFRWRRERDAPERQPPPRHGPPQVEAETAAQEESDGDAGDSVHVSVLQPREVLRREDGPRPQHRGDLLHRLPGGVPDTHHLLVGARGCLQRLDRCLRSRKPVTSLSRGGDIAVPTPPGVTLSLPPHFVAFLLFSPFLSPDTGAPVVTQSVCPPPGTGPRVCRPPRMGPQVCPLGTEVRAAQELWGRGTRWQGTRGRGAGDTFRQSPLPNKRPRGAGPGAPCPGHCWRRGVCGDTWGLWGHGVTAPGGGSAALTSSQH